MVSTSLIQTTVPQTEESAQHVKECPVQGYQMAGFCLSIVMKVSSWIMMTTATVSPPVSMGNGFLLYHLVWWSVAIGLNTKAAGQDNFTNDVHKCIAPPYPQNGKYKPLPIECALNSKSPENLLRPGTFVPASCLLLYSCNEGYLLLDEDVISICDKGQWNPKVITCIRDANAPVTSIERPGTRIGGGGGCVLPEKSQNRRYCSFDCRECSNPYNTRCFYNAGALVMDKVIKVQCQPGFRLANNIDSTAIACVNGKWDDVFPTCLKLCPPLESDSVFSRCLYGNTEVDCSSPMLPTTTATYKCKLSYTEYPSLTKDGVYKRTLTCKHNGKWSNQLPECKPACGLSRGGVKISPTIVDGIDTPLGAFPWHAGLYRLEGDNWNCICGGSLITNRIVLSAAHCVVLSTPNTLRVALGKYHRAWSIEEQYAVKRNVSSIKVPREYNGAGNTYAWDIALILLSKKVQFNDFVMPVCRDVNVELRVTDTHNTGYVVGWGKTFENGKESETLLHNDITIIDYTYCLRKIPKILSFDKFCGAKGSVSVAEKGDSGGGVTFVSNDQHYIIGIVSVKIENLSVFTNVSWQTHKSWIDNEIINFDRDIYLSEPIVDWNLES